VFVVRINARSIVSDLRFNVSPYVSMLCNQLQHCNIKKLLKAVRKQKPRPRLLQGYL